MTSTSTPGPSWRPASRWPWPASWRRLRFGEASTGAAGDFEQAIALARHIVHAGLSPLGIVDPANLDKGLEAAMVQRIIADQREMVAWFLAERRPLLQRVADVLVDTEAIDGEAIRRMLADDGTALPPVQGPPLPENRIANTAKAACGRRFCARRRYTGGCQGDQPGSDAGSGGSQGGGGSEETGGRGRRGPGAPGLGGWAPRGPPVAPADGAWGCCGRPCPVCGGRGSPCPCGCCRCPCAGGCPACGCCNCCGCCICPHACGWRACGCCCRWGCLLLAVAAGALLQADLRVCR